MKAPATASTMRSMDMVDEPLETTGKREANDGVSYSQVVVAFNPASVGD